jgi:hypothetical protein
MVPPIERESLLSSMSLSSALSPLSLMGLGTTRTIGTRLHRGQFVSLVSHRVAPTGCARPSPPSAADAARNLGGASG